MLDNYQIEAIVQYSYHQLSPSDKETFETALESQAQFKSETIVYLDLMKGFKSLEMDHLNKQLLNWEQKYHSHQKIATLRTKKLNRRRMSYVATLLILFFSVFAYRQSNTVNEPKDLFTSYFQYEFQANEYHNLLSLRNTNYFLSGLKSFKAEKYPSAIEQFEHYLDRKSSVGAELKTEIYFYLGIANIKLDNEVEASYYLEKVMTNKRSRFSKQAEWYKALNTLKHHSPLKTKAALKPLLKNTTHPYHKESIKLSLDLENID